MEERIRAPLSRNRIFKGLSPLEVYDILEIARIVSYAPGEKVFREGEEGDALYLIEKGMVQVSKEIPEVGEKILAVLREDSLFGEMALMDRGPRSATVTALVPSSFIKIEREGFERLKRGFRSSAYRVILELCRIMAERIRETNEKVVEFMVNPERNIEYFRQWKEHAGEKGKDL